jgi:hypothetical protein
MWFIICDYFLIGLTRNMSLDSKWWAVMKKKAHQFVAGPKKN